MLKRKNPSPTYKSLPVLSTPTDICSDLWFRKDCGLAALSVPQGANRRRLRCGGRTRFRGLVTSPLPELPGGRDVLRGLHGRRWISLALMPEVIQENSTEVRRCGEADPSMTRVEMHGSRGCGAPFAPSVCLNPLWRGFATRGVTCFVTTWCEGKQVTACARVISLWWRLHSSVHGFSLGSDKATARRSHVFHWLRWSGSPDPPSESDGREQG